MKIQVQDLYHGAALTQIVEHESFKALNRASTKYGHYLVNADRQVLVKYRKPKNPPWQHVLSADEVRSLDELVRQYQYVILCLVCGQMTVCALNASEIQDVIDLGYHTQQWVRIEVPRRGSCHVSGSKGKLKRHPAQVLSEQSLCLTYAFLGVLTCRKPDQVLEDTVLDPEVDGKKAVLHPHGDLLGFGVVTDLRC